MGLIFQKIIPDLALLRVDFCNDRFISPISGKYSLDGITWSNIVFPATPPGGTIILNGVAYGNGIYVAPVGYSDSPPAPTHYMTSTDGINWVYRLWPVSNFYTMSREKNIVFGNGIFVITGTGPGATSILTSTDGINWNARAIGGTDPYIDYVAYGNGIFVAVKSNRTTYTSVDGINWTENLNSLPVVAVNGSRCIAFGGGLFVALVANSNTKLVTSVDGVIWTEYDLPTSQWRTVRYGGGLWVFANKGATWPATSNYRIASTSNFVTWTEYNLDIGSNYDSDFGLGKFVVAAIDNNSTYSETTYTLTYIAGSGGTITGITSQTINPGSNGTEVTVVPNTGYYFLAWSDGLTTPSRTDLNIQSDMALTANFVSYSNLWKVEI